MRTFLILCAAAIVVGLVFWYEYSVWDECLKDHSWMYCNRVLNKN